MNGETIRQLDLFKEALGSRRPGPELDYAIPDGSSEYYSGNIEQDQDYLKELLTQRLEFLDLLVKIDNAFIDIDNKDDATQAIPLGPHNSRVDKNLGVTVGDKIFARIIVTQQENEEATRLSEDKMSATSYFHGYGQTIIVEYFSATTEELTPSQITNHDRNNIFFNNNSMENIDDERHWYEIQQDIFGGDKFRSTDPKQQNSIEIMGDPNDANAPMQAAHYAEFIGNEIKNLRRICTMMVQGIAEFADAEQKEALELNAQRTWYEENLTGLILPKEGERIIHKIVREIVAIEPVTEDVIDLRDGKKPSPIYDQTLHTKDSDFSNA